MGNFEFNAETSVPISSENGTRRYAYGVTVSESLQFISSVSRIESLDLDFSCLTKDSVYSSDRNWRECVRLDLLKEGLLVYVQSGGKTMMTYPYIVSSLEYNPTEHSNERTEWSIRLRLEPTYAHSNWVEIYMQLPQNPKEHTLSVNLWDFSEHTEATDGSLSQIQNTGGFIPMPDQAIIESFPDEFGSETVLSHFI